MKNLKRGSRGVEVKMLQKALNDFGKYGLVNDGIFGAKTEMAVKDFQFQTGLVTDGIVGVKTWERLGLKKEEPGRKITEIIVHCSATPEGKDFTVDDIRRWHKARGLKDIGYHWVIYRDGSIHKGREESEVGAHCTNHNYNSVGVCYIGGLANDNKKTPKDTRTDSQKESMCKLLKELKDKYPSANIYPHYKFANKACPCFDAEKEYSHL